MTRPVSRDEHLIPSARSGIPHASLHLFVRGAAVHYDVGNWHAGLPGRPASPCLDETFTLHRDRCDPVLCARLTDRPSCRGLRAQKLEELRRKTR